MKKKTSRRESVWAGAWVKKGFVGAFVGSGVGVHTRRSRGGRVDVCVCVCVVVSSLVWYGLVCRSNVHTQSASFRRQRHIHV